MESSGPFVFRTLFRLHSCLVGYCPGAITDVAATRPTRALGTVMFAPFTNRHQPGNLFVGTVGPPCLDPAGDGLGPTAYLLCGGGRLIRCAGLFVRVGRMLHVNRPLVPVL